MKPLVNEKISNLLKVGKVFVQTAAGKAVVAGVAVVLVGGAVTIGVASHMSASVSASTKNSIASSMYSVSSPLVEVKTITLDKANCEVTVQNKTKLNATINPANATNHVLTWTSSDNAIATVGSDGMVTGVFAGAVTITVASDNGVKATCKVTVSAVKDSSSSDVLKEGGKPVVNSSTASKSSSVSRNTSSVTVSHKAPSKSSTAPVPAAPVPATQPAGTSGFAFNSSLSKVFNEKAAENKNTAFFSTLYNNTLNAIQNHKGTITKQGDLNNEIGQLTTTFGKMMDRNTMSEYTHNGQGYSVDNCWNTVISINSGDARTLYNTAKSQGFFSQIQQLGTYFTDVPSERFAYTFVFYDPNTRTNKLIRFVWYVMPAATRVS